MQIMFTRFRIVRLRQRCLPPMRNGVCKANVTNADDLASRAQCGSLSAHSHTHTHIHHIPFCAETLLPAYLRRLEYVINLRWIRMVGARWRWQTAGKHYRFLEYMDVNDLVIWLIVIDYTTAQYVRLLKHKMGCQGALGCHNNQQSYSFVYASHVQNVFIYSDPRKE